MVLDLTDKKMILKIWTIRETKKITDESVVKVYVSVDTRISLNKEESNKIKFVFDK